MMKHFTASKVILETAKRAWTQIVGILSLMFFIVAVFAILLFEMEKGKFCFAGDIGCEIPSAFVSTVKIGQRVTTDKLGNPIKFGKLHHLFVFL